MARSTQVVSANSMWQKSVPLRLLLSWLSRLSRETRRGHGGSEKRPEKRQRGPKDAQNSRQNKRQSEGNTKGNIEGNIEGKIEGKIDAKYKGTRGSASRPRLGAWALASRISLISPPEGRTAFTDNFTANLSSAEGPKSAALAEDFPYLLLGDFLASAKQ